MDLVYRNTFSWSGWADGCNPPGQPNGSWGDAANAPTEPWAEFYNDSRQFWAIDLRSLANQYPDYNLDYLYIESWTRKKKHSERHLITVHDYFANSWQPNPNSQPWNPLYYSGSLAPPQYIWTSKNGVRSKFTDHWLRRTIPLSQFRNSPLYISVAGDPNSRREYGWVRVVGLRAWRERQAFPGWASTVMRQADKAVPGWGSQLLGGGHWLSEYRSEREWLGISWPPLGPDSWTHRSGRSSNIPGTMWGGSQGYATFTPPTKQRVVGVQIEINISKKQGSYHGDGGRFGASASNAGYPGTQWYAGDWSGIQTQWLDCNIPAGAPIYIWGSKGSDRGDGASYHSIRIVGLRYG